MSKRYSVERAVECLLSLENGEPNSINKIAKKFNLSWKLVDRAVNTVISLQDFCDAYELMVIDSPRMKLVVLDLRVRITKLPQTVADWFLTSKFFTTDKLDFDTKTVQELVGIERKGRTSLGEALRRVTLALRYRDEISIRELSIRTGINRRTVERAIRLIMNVQETLAKHEFNLIGTELFKTERRDLYQLDASRMTYVLKRRYLDMNREIPLTKEKVLMKL